MRFTAGTGGANAPPLAQAVKKAPTFLTAFKNAVTFVPLCGTKVLALLAANLAAQGIAGHSIPFEAGCAPSSTPAYSLTFFSRIERFFDRLSMGGANAPPIAI